MHNNVFAHGDDENGAYQAFQRDSKRDHRQIQLMDIAILVAVIWLARRLEATDFVAVLVILFAGMSRLNTFIDNSNRNFFLHHMDWIALRRGQARPGRAP